MKMNLNKLLSFILLFFFFKSASLQAQPSSLQTELPTCYKDLDLMASLKSSLQHNNLSPNKYRFYKELLNKENKNIIKNRLIYAETKASLCPEQEQLISEIISEVIQNRIRIRNNKTLSVIFERNQFSSSLNIYQNSKYKDFLCPQDLKLWASLQTLETKENRITSKFDVHYFLYKHDPRWTKEPWILKESDLQLSKAIKSRLKECIKVFENKSWK